MLPEKFADPAAFVRDFEALATVFHSRELRIVGGEPLLHPDLPRFLAEARRIGIADSIVVYTNGVLLHRVPEQFWRLIDELRVSVYPGIRRRLDDEACARLCDLHGVRLHFERYQTFGQTLIGKHIEDRRLDNAQGDNVAQRSEGPAGIVIGTRVGGRIILGVEHHVDHAAVGLIHPHHEAARGDFLRLRLGCFGFWFGGGITAGLCGRPSARGRWFRHLDFRLAIETVDLRSLAL